MNALAGSDKHAHLPVTRNELLWSARALVIGLYRGVPIERWIRPLARCTSIALLGVLGLASVLMGGPAHAQDSNFLKGMRHFSTLGSTVPENGDQNPYAIVVAPVSAGKIRKDDVLVGNFNDRHNLQGLGTTIVDYRPATKQFALFAAIPRHLPQCVPAGIVNLTAVG